MSHGHQRAILHRDLKPSNILVAPDRKPKVIDFGVARTMDLDVTRITLEASFKTLVGTLQYMSPEQCQGDPHAVDVRGDVYSLGVILYELLVGRRPYELGDVGILRATKMIAEQAPIRPSSLDRRFSGDLETVLLAALAKNPESRYQSAAGLAGDLRRYLRHEPILVRPPTPTDRLRKFVRRNRAVAALGALLVVAIVGGALGISLSLIEARSQRDAAIYETEKAVAVTRFLDGMLATPFDSIDGTKATVSELLDRASLQLEKSFEGKERTVATLRRTLGRSYEALGLYAKARSELADAYALSWRIYGADDPVVLELLIDLAGSTHDCGDLEEAEALLQDGLEALSRRPLTNAEQVFRAQNYLGLVWIDLEEFAKARDLLIAASVGREELLGLTHAQTIQSLLNLSVAELQLGNEEESWRLVNRCVDSLENATDADLETLAFAKDRLAVQESSRGEEENAVLHMKEVLGIYEWIYPKGHPKIAQMLSKLGWTLNRWRKPDLAEPYLRRSVEIYREKAGAAHSYTTTVNMYLGISLGMQRKYGEALEVYEQNLDCVREHYGEEHFKTAHAFSLFAHALYQAQDRAAAVRVASEARVLLRKVEDPLGVTTLILENLHARLQRDLGNLDEALDVVEAALRVELPPSWDREWVRADLETSKAEVLVDRGKLDRAKELLIRSYPVLAQGPPLRQERAGSILVRLAQRFEEEGRGREASDCRAVCSAEE